MESTSREQSTASAMSPTSRTRLVVASQSLEIQHLQEVINSKDREIQSITGKFYDERTDLERQLAHAQARNSRLEGQVTLLGEKLRSIEEGKEANLLEEVSAIADFSQAGKDRDTLISQLRDDLRHARAQNTTMQQERAIFVDQLATERQRANDLAKKLEGYEERYDEGGSSGRRPTTTRVVHRGMQTSDPTGSADGGETSPTRTAELSVEELKQAVEFEKGQQEYFASVAALHAANSAHLTSIVQKRIEQEMHRLAIEQDRYKQMLSSWQSGGNGTIHSSSGYPGHNNSTATPSHQQRTPTKPSSAAANQSNPSSPMMGDASSFNFNTPSAATSSIPRSNHYSVGHHQHNESSAYPSQAGSLPSNFVFQQQEEMAVLRRRLDELQNRHRTGRSSSQDNNQTSNSTGNTSRYGAANHSMAPHSQRDLSVTSGYHHQPRSTSQHQAPTTLRSASGGTSSQAAAAPSQAASHKLSRQAAESMHQSKPSVQRMLQKAMSH